MAKVIVGISGFAGSGKDTLADHLCEHYGFKKASLADPMKRVCQTIFDFDPEQLWGASSRREEPDERYRFSGICPTCHEECTVLLDDALDFKRPGDMGWWCARCEAKYPVFVTPRMALQTLGTEWGRTMCEDIWVKKALREISESEHDRWAIPDVRFRNEMRVIREHGGKVVRLRRGEQRFTHPSEAELASTPDSEYDFVIDNTREKAYLFAEGDRFLQVQGVLDAG